MRPAASPKRTPQHEQEGVEDPAIFGDRIGREQELHLVAGEQRRRPPLWVLVAQLGELVLREHAGGRGDHLVDDEVREELVQRAVDPADGPRCEFSGAETVHEVADGAHPDLGHGELPQDRQHVLGHDRLVVVDVAQAELPATLDPLRHEGLQEGRDGLPWGSHPRRVS